MIATVSAAVSASPLGRAIAKWRNGPTQGLDLSSLLDWVIPPALFAIIVVAAAWLAFGAK